MAKKMDAADKVYAKMGPKAAKADEAMDKKLGVKYGSKADMRIDRAVASAVKGKKGK